MNVEKENSNMSKSAAKTPRGKTDPMAVEDIIALIGDKCDGVIGQNRLDRKSTRLNSSHW